MLLNGTPETVNKGSAYMAHIPLDPLNLCIAK